MITYKFNEDKSYAQRIVDGIETGEWLNTKKNQEYLKWLEEVNTPAENT